MSADWKLTLPCTRAEAEALGEDFEVFAMLDPVPSIVTQEVEGLQRSEMGIASLLSAKTPGKDGAANSSDDPERPKGRSKARTLARY